MQQVSYLQTPNTLLGPQIKDPYRQPSPFNVEKNQIIIIKGFNYAKLEQIFNKIRITLELTYPYYKQNGEQLENKLLQTLKFNTTYVFIDRPKYKLP